MDASRKTCSENNQRNAQCLCSHGFRLWETKPETKEMSLKCDVPIPTSTSKSSYSPFLVHLGCYYKTCVASKRQKFISHCSGAWKFEVRVPTWYFSLCPHSARVGWGAGELYGTSYKTPFVRAPPSWLKKFTKVPAITLGVRISTYKFEGYIQSIASPESRLTVSLLLCYYPLCSIL